MARAAGRGDRIGCDREQVQGVGCGHVVERYGDGREVGQQRVPQPQYVPGAFADQRFMCPGQHLDRLGELAVRGDRPQLAVTDTDHVGQHMRISLVRLGTRHLDTCNGWTA